MSYSIPKFGSFKKRRGDIAYARKSKSKSIPDMRRLNSMPFWDVTSDVKENNEHRQVTLFVVGVSERSNTYSQYSKDFPNRLKIVGIAEPRKLERSAFQIKYGIEEKYTFSDWKEAVSLEKMADAVLIASSDGMNFESCIAFADRGYHILCEKPMASTEMERQQMVDVCKRNNVILSIGDILRYSNVYMTVKKIIQDGTIGDVVGIQQLESVGWWHFTHLSNRAICIKGIRNVEALMAKTCQDLDLIKHFLGDIKCKKIQSFGSLTNFNLSNRLDLTERCADCKIERSHQTPGVQNYLEPIKRGFLHFTSCMRSILKENNQEKSTRDRAVNRKKSVYFSDTDSDFCDYQTINMEFEKGKYVTFTMSAFTKDECSRKIDIFGTKGQIDCNNSDIKLYDYTTGKNTIISVPVPFESTSISGPGFSDYYLMKAFVKAVAENDSDFISSATDGSLRGHQLVFAAEKSRGMRGVMMDVDI